MMCFTPFLWEEGEIYALGRVAHPFYALLVDALMFYALLKGLDAVYALSPCSSPFYAFRWR